MNLEKLFEMQKVLDDHIMDEHPELKGKNNLDWKTLALQVELGECAQEWRGFKKWSKNQEPRTLATRFPAMMEEDKEYYNPLLEEYVDCLHFVLSIGSELNETLINYDYAVYGFVESSWNTDSTIEQFQVVFADIAQFSRSYDEPDYIELVSQFLGLGEMLGFTWEQIEQAYFSKNAVNHQRQEDGY
jgi:dimeric dUTPase (all-alpha-NTP-PPase superfamily)